MGSSASSRLVAACVPLGTTWGFEARSMRPGLDGPDCRLRADQLFYQHARYQFLGTKSCSAKIEWARGRVATDSRDRGMLMLAVYDLACRGLLAAGFALVGFRPQAFVDEDNRPLR